MDVTVLRLWQLASGPSPRGTRTSGCPSPTSELAPRRSTSLALSPRARAKARADGAARAFVGQPTRLPCPGGWASISAITHCSRSHNATFMLHTRCRCARLAASVEMHRRLRVRGRGTFHNRWDQAESCKFHGGGSPPSGPSCPLEFAGGCATAPPCLAACAANRSCSVPAAAPGRFAAAQPSQPADSSRKARITVSTALRCRGVRLSTPSGKSSEKGRRRIRPLAS